MITRKDEERMNEMLQKRWEYKYFHNDQSLQVADMYRDIERANPHYRVNASAALFKRLRNYLEETGRIEIGQLRANVGSRNSTETREWIKQFGSIRTFHDFCKQYDLSVKEIRLAFDQVYHKVKIVFKTKNCDEGFYGGGTTLRYEVERIREERKIEMQRKLLLKKAE